MGGAAKSVTKPVTSAVKSVTGAAGKVASAALAPVTGGASILYTKEKEKQKKKAATAAAQKRLQQEEELELENKRMAKMADIEARKQKKSGFSALVGEGDSQTLG